MILTKKLFILVEVWNTDTLQKNGELVRLRAKAGIPRLSMHALRHTYATRCIEAGMRPETLQMLLGHSNINITMNLYVHVMDDEKKKEVEKIEMMLNVG